MTATTSFVRFLDDAAFGAYGTGGRRSDGWCLYANIGQDEKEKNAVIVKSYSIFSSLRLHDITLELTFASLNALKPPVINVPVADTSTILKPSTARSATTDSAEFLERATPWARFHISNRRGGDCD